MRGSAQCIWVHRDPLSHPVRCRRMSHLFSVLVLYSGTLVCTVVLMQTTTPRPLPETTSSIWSALWADYIASLRNGHRERAAKLRAELDRFDQDVLGL